MINYHFVFCPRYRRKVLLGEVETRFKLLLKEICANLEIEVMAIKCDKDHCHLFVNALPHLSPADIMAKVKGVTSRKLRREFKQPATYEKSVDKKLFCFYCGEF